MIFIIWFELDYYADGMYNQRMTGFPNKACSKEANLMPVPSPQQIQFPLLDGQELTIQKQPNTSLRDTDLVSPRYGIVARGATGYF